MVSIPSSAEQSGPAFEFKGRMLTLSVLRLLTPDLERLALQLDAKLAQAPELFSGLPVLLDLEALGPAELPDLARLLALLRERRLQPIGVRAGGDELAQAAAAAELVVLSGVGQDAPRRAAPAPPAPSAGMVVTQPIRSGQQVYARGGDLVVLSSVSPTAEILADGNIHVYGVLRGRALAGVQGNADARIFCRSLQAELISIAGTYQLSEQFGAAARGGPVQAMLRDGAIRIEPL